MSNLHQRTAIVTGGSRGLGRGIVEALAARDTRVIALARASDQLAAMASDKVIPVAADAADEAVAERLLREEQPDLVVLCAGVSPVLQPLHQLTWSEFSQPWEMDAKSAFVWCKHALLQPLKKGAHIIVVSSGAAVAGSPVSGGYAGAKRTQWFIADYTAAESARAKLELHVHCLLPNLNSNTDLGRAAIKHYAARNNISEADYAKRFDPQLTPAIIGTAVVELFENPARFDKPVYRIGGNGLIPLG